MCPAIGSGKGYELVVLTGVGFEDEVVGRRCAKIVCDVGELIKELVIGRKAVFAISLFGIEGGGWLKREGGFVEPIPIGVDIREIGYDKVEVAMFSGVKVGE